MPPTKLELPLATTESQTERPDDPNGKNFKENVIVRSNWQPLNFDPKFLLLAGWLPT